MIQIGVGLLLVTMSLGATPWAAAQAAAEAAGVRGVLVESNASLMNTVKRELRTA